MVVVNPDGRTLRTQALKYDNATNTISTDVPFTFDRGDEHLEGNSFKSDPGLQERRDGQAAGCDGDRNAAAGPGHRFSDGDPCSAAEARAAEQGSAPGCHRRAEGLAMRRLVATVRPRTASPSGLHAQAKPPGQAFASIGRSSRPVCLPDRQRGSPGRRERDAERNQLLRGRKCSAAVPRHPDLDAERQRRGVWRVGRPVHRQREVS